MIQIVCDIPKNTKEIVRVELSEFQGRQVFAVRVWYFDGKEYKPSRNGICLSARHLSAMSKAIAEAERLVVEASK